MHSRRFARASCGDVEVDLCVECRVFWFDKGESGQLSASAVIELFREIHALAPSQRRPMSAAAGCPRCGARLVLTHDIAKSGKLTYYRCPGDHGRLTPFYQFLREKRFVRDLGAGELAQLRARVAQIQCSNCGAPIDLAESPCCGYCQSPLAVLDHDAVDTALREWGAQARAETAGVDPCRLADALALAERERALRGPAGPWNDAVRQVATSGDLLATCIDLAAVAVEALLRR
jgi:hypothetical protein